jgi:hypothetical protein
MHLPAITAGRHVAGRNQPYYRLAFLIPGSSPLRANWRKQMRHIPTNRMYPRGRPHLSHRLWNWTGYFIVPAASSRFWRFHFSTFVFLAKWDSRNF